MGPCYYMPLLTARTWEAGSGQSSVICGVSSAAWRQMPQLAAWRKWAVSFIYLAAAAAVLSCMVAKMVILVVKAALGNIDARAQNGQCLPLLLLLLLFAIAAAAAVCHSCCCCCCCRYL